MCHHSLSDLHETGYVGAFHVVYVTILLLSVFYALLVVTIITSDNPRFEEPQAIIDDILTGMKKTDGEYISIIDRHEAISYAMHHAQPGDIVVLAGKGHETYQEIEGKKYHMSEEEIVQDVLDGKY